MISLTKDWVNKMNEFGNKQRPFFFLIPFDKTEAYVSPMDNISPTLRFEINGDKFQTKYLSRDKQIIFEKFPISLDEYQHAFLKVFDKINKGYSYLTNLTFATEIKTNLTLEEIYAYSDAKYKLLIKDTFVVFSPECFVKIIDDVIYTYPMKGTIDASIPDADSLLLKDEKEKAEHFTIVDLLRNDLSQVAYHVTVSKFRYIDKIKTTRSEILQTSSEIQGSLQEHYKGNLGDLFDKLLPAGSISGAPKLATLDIIKDVERDARGFYTGVFGYFDGKNLDSGVMIRFIEQSGEKKYYRSGGGITSMSDAEAEYKEMIDKVYVPINRKYLDK